MVIGLGIDITELPRIARSYARFGQHFLRKILTESELAALPSQVVPYVAGRFAVKEAAVKALGTGFSMGISPLHIATVRDGAGQPQLQLTGPAQTRAQALGVRRCHVSISHEHSVAVAVVILESA